MMRSMFAGVSGLRNHQTRMDVIGNNIANVNTTGFKASRVTFQELFNQTLRGASSPQGNRGGTNPLQIGLGMTIGSIDVLQTPGNLESTGKMTDLAIEGDGFFIVGEGTSYLYTRAGNFNRDADGYLVNPAGYRLKGWVAQGGVLDESLLDANNLTDIRIPVGSAIDAKATDRVTFGKNLDGRVAIGTVNRKPINVYDSLGNSHDLVFSFEKTADNTWEWTVTVDGAAPSSPAGPEEITFDTNGHVASGGIGAAIEFTPTGADTVSITPDFSNLTQYASATTAEATDRNGYPSGSLQTFTVDSTGVITGVYSNGLTQKLAQVALASFPNPEGLIREGGNLFRESNNSGIRQIGSAGTAGRGSIAPSSLEMSNVDLAGEFTNMIIAQRGFQANSRIITASDEMLQELVNLKR